MGETVSKVIGGTVGTVYPDANKITHTWKHTEYTDIREDEKIEEKRLVDCQFKSSHNSVVGDVQVLGPASINILARVLNKGVRAIELDVFESLKVPGKPVVSHGNLGQNLQVVPPVDFEVCCKYIRDYGWVDTNEPMFMFLEMNVSKDNKETLANMLDILVKYLASRIYITKRKLTEVPLDFVVGKLCVIPSIYIPEFKTICPTYLYGSNEFVNISSNHAAVKPNGKFVRVYAANTLLSNNPNPLPFLNYGCQFVCMNWSFEDEGLKAYKEFFLR
jgi:hypothetical protein